MPPNRKPRPPGRVRACLAALAAWPFAAAAAVNDMMPTDYVTLPGGYTSVTAYAFFRDIDGLYVRGHRSPRVGADAQIAAIRYSHFLEGMPLPTALTAIVPVARATIEPPLPAGFNDQASGLADPRFSLTVWPISDPDHTHYLGFTAMVLPPLGDYHRHDALNIGENRWQAVLLLGWTRALNERWTLDVTPEIAWYGDNERYLGHNRLSQDLSYALTGYLRYRVAPQHQLMLGGQWNEGGATELNGRDFGGEPGQRKLYAGWMASAGANAQFMLRYAHDLEVENGQRFDNELMLRMLWWFK